MDNNSSETLPTKAYPDESTLSEAYRRLEGFNALKAEQMLASPMR